MSRTSVLALSIATLVLAVVAAALVPMWAAPDEPQHFMLARLVADIGRWPTLNEARDNIPLLSSVYDSMVQSGFWERQRHREPPPSLLADTAPDNFLPPVYAPPAYYVMAAGVLRLVGPASLDKQVYVLRGLSAVLSTLAVACSLLVVRDAFARQPGLAWAASLLIVLLPMRTFLAPNINSDALADLVGAVAVLLMVRSLQADPPRLGWHAVAIGLTVGLGLWVKRTLVFLLPLSLVWLGVALWRREVRVRGWRLVVGLAAGLVLLGGASLLWKGASLTPDWPFPGREPGNPAGIDVAFVRDLLSPRTWSWSAMLRLALNLALSLASFWGNFGWLTLPLNPGMYVLLAGATLGSVAGLVLALRRHASVPNGLGRVWVLLGAAAALSLAQLVTLSVAQAATQQGRYLFPALAPIAGLMTLGWRRVLPTRLRPLTPYLAGGGLAALTLASWLFVVLPGLRGWN